MRKFAFFTFYVVSPIPLIHAFYMANPVKYTNTSLMVAMLAGVLAYNWVVWQFILSARTQWIEIFVPLDRIYRLHGVTAVLILVAGIGHKIILEAFFAETFMTELGSIALGIFIGITIISVGIATKDRWLLWQQISRFRVVIEKYRYEHNKLVHNLTFIALLLMHGHVLMTSAAKSSNKVYVTLMIYFMIAVALYLYHKLLKRWYQQEYASEIIEVIEESPMMATLKLKVLSKNMTYHPGQFAFFTLKVNGRKETHPFSFSSGMDERENLAITVKNLGDFSGGIGQLSKGTKVMIEGPFGEFSYMKHKEEEHLYMIAGGVGITPMLSMIKSLWATDKTRKIVLMWGIKSKDEMAFSDELNVIKQEMPYLMIVPVVSDDFSYDGETGFIDRVLIEQYMLAAGLDPKVTGFYICGPRILQKLSIKALKEMGIDGERIHYESFSM